MDAAQLQALADGISGLVQEIRTDEAAHRNEQRLKESLKEQLKGIRVCDGTIPTEVREWLEDIEVAIPLLNNVQHAAIKLATKSVSGSLKKEIERFLDTQPNRLGTPWNLLRDHVRISFLSANENERLKSELEKLQQLSHEAVSIFNRKFREAAHKAYPAPRTVDAERILVRAYARALYSSNMAKKLITEGHPVNLEGAITIVETQAAGLELFDSIERKSRDEPMEIGSAEATPDPMSRILSVFRI